MKLVVGIAIAWFLGAYLEELTFRGIVLKMVEAQLSTLFPLTIAAAISICIAAAGAGIIHLYQGPRATFIIIQLSILFGLLFVLSRDTLWAVILCHGMYDTIAFIRFAGGKSRYSKFAHDRADRRFRGPRG
jgi:membrane protease YdiL (CAAX protease family)